MSAVHVLLGFPDMALSISTRRTETEIRKERLWLLMHGLSSSPPSYVQVSYSSILLTNVLHNNTESFTLLFHILFLKGSSIKQLTVAKVEYSLHLSGD
jgi:hypothetical protein